MEELTKRAYKADSHQDLIERKKNMVKSEKYIVGSGNNTVYKALFEMIPQDDTYMHLRLSGALCDVCNDIYFLTHKDGKGLSRIWMGYGKQEGAVCNWGAVFTPEEYRGKGYCGRTLDYCFGEIDSMETPPPALFCSAGSMAPIYAKYGFVPALKGTDSGPMYRPCGDSPKSFREFCEGYYTSTEELLVVDAHFGWRNEIDCLLKFALWDMGEAFGIGEARDLSALLMQSPKRARILLSRENRCVGWEVDGIRQLHPKYRHIERITDQSTPKGTE